ncbi:hypothetical protein EGJ89_17260 [Stenotrophomonas maltophilia]|nr:hypothetical protein EGJ89_17260 [Stenotrophomonas maltophilia]
MPCAQDSAHEQAATELTWTYLQRPPQRDPPRHPTECTLLLRLLPLPLPLRVPGGSPAQAPTHAGRMRTWLSPCSSPSSRSLAAPCRSP